MNGFRDVKTMLLGKTLRSDQLHHEKLSRTWGLPIMASDAVSSVAYAVEEILMALVPALGFFAVQYVGLVSIPIILLLMILVFSYAQIIKHYPNGGGSYVVSRENFGRRASLLAAACLVIDYIMTVAVSISSATAAIVAVWPKAAPYGVVIALVCIAFVTLINLRGLSESSKIFGVPTYAFIFALGAMIVAGFIKMGAGTIGPIQYTAEQRALVPDATLAGITVMLFLRAFSSGCSALTGVEAVSNAVPNFKKPEQKTATQVLYLLGVIIVFLFGGTSFLATQLQVVPMPETTVMSQMAQAVFGSGVMFYVLQFTTSLILLLAANTAYNGLPILMALLAKDSYMPRQFSHRGAKLSFSNGILFIFIAGAILLVAFNADTHRLIPFYAVGVFISFTLSQAGMFMKWARSKEKGWRHKSIINAVGAVVTLVGTVVVFTNKFADGAWALMIIIPLIMLFMSLTHKHYYKVGKSISIEGYDYHYQPSKSRDKLPCVVLIHRMSRAALKTLSYAQDVSSDVTALHISTTPSHTEDLQRQWKELGIGIPLTVVETPYRDLMPPLEQYISEREKQLKKGENLTVILTKFVGGGWMDAIFHNQTAFLIERQLGKHKNVVTTLVPFIYYHTEKEEKAEA